MSDVYSVAKVMLAFVPAAAEADNNWMTHCAIASW
jgi:hypothetical protein